jgi:hypothetical protein
MISYYPSAYRLATTPGAYRLTTVPVIIGWPLPGLYRLAAAPLLIGWSLSPNLPNGRCLSDGPCLSLIGGFLYSILFGGTLSNVNRVATFRVLNGGNDIFISVGVDNAIQELNQLRWIKRLGAIFSCNVENNLDSLYKRANAKCHYNQVMYDLMRFNSPDWCHYKSGRTT